MTDSSEVYRIAMGMFLILVLYMFYRYLFYCNIVLHPRHKLSYFKQAGWPTEWINTAEDIVRTKFNRSYAVNNDTEDENDDEDIVVMVRSSMLFFFSSSEQYIYTTIEVQKYFWQPPRTQCT